MSAAPSWVTRWSVERGDPHLVSLVRAAIGALLAYQSGARLLELHRDGYFAETYHLPLWPAALVPSAPVYLALIALQIALALAIVLGVRARPALLLASGTGLYLLGCDRLQYHNNRYALLVMAFLLAFTPCDATLTIERRAAPAGADVTAPRPLWGQRLAQLQVGIVYLASGGSKLLDADWRGGLVLGDRIHRYGSIAVGYGVPSPVITFLSHPTVADVLAKAAIATELGLVVALWLPRSRALALWWGVAFHLTIQVTAKVDIFTWLTLSTYALYAIPATRERKAYVGPGGARWAVALRALDWLRRFDVRPAGEADAPALRLVDRDGRSASGLDAWVLACRALPLLFPLWVPLHVLARLRRRTPSARGKAGPA